MSIFYKSARVGKNGNSFWMLKFRTLKEVDKTSHFTTEDQYLPLGRFLRKTKLDELPQIWNVLKGEMVLVGPRPEEARTIDLLPEDTKKILLSVKPGMVDLASLYFFDEEKILQESPDMAYDYWVKVKPIKTLFQVFYIKNRSLALNLWLLWATFWRIIRSFFR